MDNCCVWCLQQGRRCVESLWHFTFQCEGTSGCRTSSRVASLLAKGRGDVFRLSRDVWEWGELDILAGYFASILESRSRWMAGGEGSHGLRVLTLRERVQLWWHGSQL